MLGLGGRLGWVPPTPLTPVVAELLLLTVDKTGVEVVVGGSIEKKIVYKMVTRCLTL